MSRVENPNLEKFIKNFVVNALENCNDFVKVYKKGFARRKIEDNVKHVFSNEYSKSNLGYHKSNESSITICSNKRDEPLLTPKDVCNDEDKLTTILHESIHAILTKDEQYCKKHDIVSGSGMFEICKTGESGRGLNEGLTNWICREAGHYTITYPELTNLVFELELAIGTEKVMKLGKGDLKKNVPQLLGMNKAECKAFIDETDEICYNYYKLVDISVLISILKKYLDNKDNKTFEEQQKGILKEAQELKVDDKYSLLIEEIKNSHVENSIKNQISLLNDAMKELFEEEAGMIKDTESRIFTKYFEKEWNEILKSQQIAKKDFIKFRDLNALMYKENGLNEDASEYSSERFQRQFEIAKKLYLNELIKNSAIYYNSGKLTLERAKNLIDNATEIGENERNHMIENLSVIIAKDNAVAAQKLMEYLVDKNKIEDINQYEIYYAKAGKSNIQLFAKNKKIEFTSNSISRKNIKAKDIIENPNGIFEFTLALNENDKNIIKEFLQIKERIEKQNPDANIEIFDRTIVVDYGYKKNIYFIENGMVLPAEIENMEPIRIGFQTDKRKLLPVKYQKRNFFDRIIQKIRDNILKNPNEAVLYSGGNSDKTKEFRKSMVVYRKNDAGSQRRRKKDRKIVYRKTDSDEKSR